MSIDDLPFREVWAFDTEFTSPPGEPPTPICVVARELRSGRVIRLFGDELQRDEPPYAVDEDSLVVAYYASAEVSCHLALGWRTPARILDLFAEFRCMTNGRDLPCGDRGLLGALTTFGLPAVDAARKQVMRELAMRGGPYEPSEARQLLDYCESDVDAVARLLERMVDRIDLPRALLRGRFMVAAARIERAGVPIDVESRRLIVDGWDRIKADLISEIDAQFGVYDGPSFRTERFEKYLAANHIAWPRLDSGRLALDDRIFKAMVRVHPKLAPLRELRQSLAELRPSQLAVGRDGRNRALVSAFGASSSRNTPSSTKSIFGPSVWQRSLIQAVPGHALAYLDFEQQEFGIAAALSGDVAMLAAYESGDPYLEFGKQAGKIPRSGTKATHEAERELFKGCALGVQYGMEAETLATRLNVAPVDARNLLSLHRSTFRRFWPWSDGAVEYAMLHGRLHTVFGWVVHCSTQPNPRSFRNFLMQGNGAEMLRLACCFATERGITVCAPVHDALLVEAPTDEIDDVVERTSEAMKDASAAVLGGFRLRTEAKVFRSPDRYDDRRGREMWSRVMRLVAR